MTQTRFPQAYHWCHTCPGIKLPLDFYLDRLSAAREGMVASADRVLGTSKGLEESLGSIRSAMTYAPRLSEARSARSTQAPLPRGYGDRVRTSPRAGTLTTSCLIQLDCMRIRARETRQKSNERGGKEITAKVSRSTSWD